MVGRPSGIDSREPCISIIRSRPPVPVVIEVLEAYDPARAVPRRRRILVTAFPAIAPAIEIIGPANLVHFSIQRRRPAEREALPGVHGVALPISGRLALSFTDGHHGVVSIFGRVDAVTPGLVDCERLVGRIDFKDIVAIQIPHSHAQAACAELNLDRAIVEIEKRKTGVGREVESGRSQLYFGAGIAIRPNFIAGGHGSVRNRIHPLILSGGLERNGALHVTEPRHSARRIILILRCCPLPEGNAKGRHQNQRTRHSERLR
jgi:hypothetical protein